MSRQTLNFPAEKLDAALDVLKQMQHALGVQGVLPHYSTPFDSDGAAIALVEAADASSLATSKTLAAALATALTDHGADTDAHSASTAIAIAAWTSDPAEPADLTEVMAVLNEVKDDLNTHLADSTVHRGEGGEGKATIALVTTADATDQGTANTLANALKAALNAHAVAGAQTIEIVDN